LQIDCIRLQQGYTRTASPLKEGRQISDGAAV